MLPPTVNQGVGHACANAKTAGSAQALAQTVNSLAALSTSISEPCLMRPALSMALRNSSCSWAICGTGPTQATRAQHHECAPQARRSACFARHVAALDTARRRAHLPANTQNAHTHTHTHRERETNTHTHTRQETSSCSAWFRFSCSNRLSRSCQPMGQSSLEKKRNPPEDLTDQRAHSAPGSDCP